MIMPNYFVWAQIPYTPCIIASRATEVSQLLLCTELADTNVTLDTRRFRTESLRLTPPGAVLEPCAPGRALPGSVDCLEATNSTVVTWVNSPPRREKGGVLSSAGSQMEVTYLLFVIIIMTTSFAPIFLKIKLCGVKVVRYIQMTLNSHIEETDSP